MKDDLKEISAKLDAIKDDLKEIRVQLEYANKKVRISMKHIYCCIVTLLNKIASHDQIYSQLDILTSPKSGHCGISACRSGEDEDPTDYALTIPYLNLSA